MRLLHVVGLCALLLTVYVGLIFYQTNPATATASPQFRPLSGTVLNKNGFSFLGTSNVDGVEIDHYVKDDATSHQETFITNPVSGEDIVLFLTVPKELAQTADLVEFPGTAPDDVVVVEQDPKYIVRGSSVRLVAPASRRADTVVVITGTSLKIGSFTQSGQLFDVYGSNPMVSGQVGFLTVRSPSGMCSSSIQSTSLASRQDLAQKMSDALFSLEKERKQNGLNSDFSLSNDFQRLADYYRNLASVAASRSILVRSTTVRSGQSYAQPRTVVDSTLGQYAVAHPISFASDVVYAPDAFSEFDTPSKVALGRLGLGYDFSCLDGLQNEMKDPFEAGRVLYSRYSLYRAALDVPSAGRNPTGSPSVSLTDAIRTQFSERLAFLKELYDAAPVSEKAAAIDPFQAVDPGLQVSAKSHQIRFEALELISACLSNARLSSMKNPDFSFDCARKTPFDHPISVGQAKCVVAESLPDDLSLQSVRNTCAGTLVRSEAYELYDPVLAMAFVEDASGKLLSDVDRDNFVYHQAVQQADQGRYGVANELFGWLKHRHGKKIAPAVLISEMSDEQKEGVHILANCLASSTKQILSPNELLEFSLSRDPAHFDEFPRDNFECLRKPGAVTSSIKLPPVSLWEENRQRVALAFNSQLVLWGLFDPATTSARDFNSAVTLASQAVSDYTSREQRIRSALPAFSANPFSAPLDDFDRFILSDLLLKKTIDQRPSFAGLSTANYLSARRTLLQTWNGLKDCGMGAIAGAFTVESATVVGGTHALTGVATIASAAGAKPLAAGLRIGAVLFATGAGLWFTYEGAHDLNAHWQELDPQGKVGGVCGVTTLALLSAHSSFHAAMEFQAFRADSKKAAIKEKLPELADSSKAKELQNVDKSVSDSMELDVGKRLKELEKKEKFSLNSREQAIVDMIKRASTIEEAFNTRRKAIEKHQAEGSDYSRWDAEARLYLLQKLDQGVEGILAKPESLKILDNDLPVVDSLLNIEAVATTGSGKPFNDIEQAYAAKFFEKVLDSTRVEATLKGKSPGGVYTPEELAFLLKVMELNHPFKNEINLFFEKFNTDFPEMLRESVRGQRPGQQTGGPIQARILGAGQKRFAILVRFGSSQAPIVVKIGRFNEATFKYGRLFGEVGLAPKTLVNSPLIVEFNVREPILFRSFSQNKRLAVTIEKYSDGKSVTDALADGSLSKIQEAQGFGDLDARLFMETAQIDSSGDIRSIIYNDAHGDNIHAPTQSRPNMEYVDVDPQFMKFVKDRFLSGMLEGHYFKEIEALTDLRYDPGYLNEYVGAFVSSMKKRYGQSGLKAAHALILSDANLKVLLIREQVRLEWSTPEKMLEFMESHRLYPEELAEFVRKNIPTPMPFPRQLELDYRTQILAIA